MTRRKKYLCHIQSTFVANRLYKNSLTTSSYIVMSTQIGCRLGIGSPRCLKTVDTLFPSVDKKNKGCILSLGSESCHVIMMAK